MENVQRRIGIPVGCSEGYVWGNVGDYDKSLNSGQNSFRRWGNTQELSYLILFGLVDNQKSLQSECKWSLFN